MTNGLHEIRPATSADAVRVLEELLRRAREGEVVAVAYVAAKRGGQVEVGWHDTDLYHHVNSGAARLAHRLAALADDPPAQA